MFTCFVSFVVNSLKTHNVSLSHLVDSQDLEASIKKVTSSTNQIDVDKRKFRSRKEERQIDSHKEKEI